MKKIILILTFLIIFQKKSHGQDTTELKYRITTLVTQYLFNDYPLSIEKVFKRHTIGLTLAIKPSTRSGGEIRGTFGPGVHYSSQNLWNFLYNSVSVGINSKYYLKSEKNLFIDVNLFYRYWWFDNKYADYRNVEGYRFKGTRTEKQNDFNLKFLLGKSFQFKTAVKMKPIIDIYCGVGLLYNMCQFETFNGTVNEIYYGYKKEFQYYWSPTLHIGLKLGLGIKKTE